MRRLLLPRAGIARIVGRKVKDRYCVLVVPICSSCSAAAKAEADALYHADAAQRTLKNFNLYDATGRSIYDSAKEEFIDGPGTAEQEGSPPLTAPLRDAGW
jgi:hypothetical protein